MLLNIISIFIGGGIGSVFRYLVSFSLSKTSISNLTLKIPIDTLFVNIFGSFLLGVLCAYFFKKSFIPSYLKLSLTIGLCGGFTTFSTFSFQTLQLIQASLYLTAFTNILLSFILSIIAVLLGGYFGKIL